MQKKWLRTFPLLFTLLINILFSFSIRSSECVVDVELCRERSVFVYKLDQLNAELLKYCSKKIIFSMDWPSFQDVFKKSSDHSVSTCLRPLEKLIDVCQKDESLKKLVGEKINQIACSFAEIDRRSIKIEERKILFMADLANDSRSTRSGPSDADYIDEFFNREFHIKEKLAELVSHKNQKNPEQLKKEAAIALKISNQGKLTTRMQELTAKFQSDMKAIQLSSEAGMEKAKKMQDLGAKFQSEMQKLNDDISSLKND